MVDSPQRHRERGGRTGKAKNLFTGDAEAAEGTKKTIKSAMRALRLSGQMNTDGHR
jgi:hypothetical protein